MKHGMQQVLVIWVSFFQLSKIKIIHDSKNYSMWIKWRNVKEIRKIAIIKAFQSK